MKWVKFRTPKEYQDVILEFSQGGHIIGHWRPESGWASDSHFPGGDVVAWSYYEPAFPRDDE